jgi:uncharacterized protein
MEWLSQTGIVIIVLTVMLFGLLSLVLLPILPGLVIIWVGALVYGLVSGFNTTAAIVIFVVITLLMIGGSLVDNLLMGASARKTGASWVAITVALIAGMVGSLYLPIFGGILLSLVALFVFELIRQRNWRAALNSTRGMALGCGWSVVARLAIGTVMIGLYLGWVFLAR